MYTGRCAVCFSCYLGLALALQTNGAGDRAKEAIVYLLTGMELMLQHAVNAALEHGEPVYIHICYDFALQQLAYLGRPFTVVTGGLIKC